MSDHDPVITRRRLPSAIWFLPFLAAMIAGWLVYKNYSEKGVQIEVTFDSAAGLEANKTKVLYRGLPAGIVKELKIDEDLSRVKAVIEMVPQTSDKLTDQALFWLVKPQVSLTGVRGLETLLSGHYIGFQPGTSGKSTYAYDALDQPPPPTKNAEGLYITLTADNARSVYQGAKVYYRDIEVGEVLRHSLSPDGQKVLIETYIEPRFTYLIKSNTHFWNASGIKIKADLPQIDIQMGSLASIIAGGIHFSSPDQTAPEATNGQEFPLYDDYEAAEDGIEVKLRFPGATEISEGAAVKSRGIQIGRVKQSTLTDDFEFLDTVLLIDPRARELLKEGSRFWLQKPEISIENLAQIGNILRGSYIELDPGQGTEQLSFTALDTAPIKAQLTRGRSVELYAEQLGSVSKGSPILYRQMPVGEVISYELDETGQKVKIHAIIQQRYSHLLKPNSRFWNASGITVNASLEGIKLDTESAAAILRGGISFFNPATTKAVKKQASSYRLFANHAAATEDGQLIDEQFKGSLPIHLITEDAGGLKAGDPVLYKQVKVGEISDSQLSKDGSSILLTGLVRPEYAHLVQSNSRFWNASGVKTEITLKKMSIQTESLNSVLTGGIAFANDAKAAKAEPKHLFTLYPDQAASQQQPLKVTVIFPAGKNIQPLADVRYKGQIVGQVADVDVINAGKELKAVLNLYRDGHFLARENSLFWIVKPTIRLSAIENPEGMLTGNYVEAIEGTGNASVAFKGLSSAPAFGRDTGLNLIIKTQELGSLQKGSPVFLRQVPVGKVNGFDLDKEGSGVEVFINIKPEYAHFVKKASVFTNISGVKVDASLFGGINVKAESLETIIGGGLTFTSPKESAQAQSGAIFTIEEKQ